MEANINNSEENTTDRWVNCPLCGHQHDDCDDWDGLDGTTYCDDCGAFFYWDRDIDNYPANPIITYQTWLPYPH